jgi:hypothetical protein
MITQVLQKLERDEVYHNITGKKELKRKRIGLGKSTSAFIRSGGRPSAYKISDIYTRSNELISKPEIRNLIHKKLIDHKIGPFVLKYASMAVFYSFKIDKEAASKIPLIVSPPPASVDLSNIQSKFDETASLDESKFEGLAEQNAKFILDSRCIFQLLVYSD